MAVKAVWDQRRWLVGALLGALAVAGLLGILAVAGLLSPQSASADAPLLGTADPGYLNAGEREFLLDETVAAGAGIIRLNAFWFITAPEPPTDPRDPADPAYNFGALDAAVRAASERGLEVFITLQRAPEWAERRPNKEDRGAFKPKIGAFGDYAAAVASRYSGSFPDPEQAGETLPRVRFYQAWNEGNLEKFLAPQYDRKGRPFSPDYYRRLLNEAYGEIKAVDPANEVIVAGTAPRGPSVKTRIDPVTFWRKVFCLKGSLKPRRNCPASASFDIFDHHPITVTQPPTKPGRHGDIFVADYWRLRKVLRAAERAGTIAGPRRHEMWASEIYWETDPPETERGFPEKRVARFLAQAIHLLDAQGVDLILNFFMIDAPLDRPGDVANVQGGLLYADGSRKKSFTAFRFPLVGDHTSKRKVEVWGIAPVAGQVVIQKRRRKRGWKQVATLTAGEREIFDTKIRLRGKGKIRAKIRGESERSLIWKVSK
jgi:hypothetical protein